MLTVTIPGLRLVSEANAHEHWRKRSTRAKAQRALVSLMLSRHWLKFDDTSTPLVVTITRIGRRLMDSDNAVGAAKHVRDAVAKWLGRDDGPDCRVDWRVLQRKGPYGVEIRIETADEARGSRREEVV